LATAYKVKGNQLKTHQNQSRSILEHSDHP